MPIRWARRAWPFSRIEVEGPAFTRCSQFGQYSISQPGLIVRSIARPLVVPALAGLDAANPADHEYVAPGRDNERSVLLVGLLCSFAMCARIKSMLANTSTQRFQFSIRGLLLTTAVIAVGFSVGCLKNARLEDGLFAVATTFIVIGLINQVADLCRTLRQTTGLSANQRFGWWFAILWRGTLVILLVGHFVLMELLATNRIALAGTADDFWFLGPLGHESLRRAIFAMCLLLVFGSMERSPSRASPRRWNGAIVLLAALAIIALVAILLRERFFIYGQVHIACAGMAMGRPPGPADTAWLSLDARAWSFFGWALAASGFVLLDLFCLRKLISCWSRGRRTRAIAVAALGISLALTAIHPVWLAARGLKGVSPCFAEVIEIAPINRWFFGLLLVVLFVTAAARRMTPAAKTLVSDPRWNWRQRPAAYLHEHRLVALFVAATILCMAVRGMLKVSSDFARLFGFPRPPMTLARDLLESSMVDPFCQLWLVVFCLALYRSIFGVARTSEGLGGGPPELPLSLFAIVWTALLATVLMAAPIFAALGFGLCLNWWRLPV